MTETLSKFLGEFDSYYVTVARHYEDYVAQYLISNGPGQALHRLKWEHSLRVMKNMMRLAASLKLDSRQYNLALLAGLLHDIGRFEQFERYHTFNDTRSVDHGQLGHDVLSNLSWLSILNSHDQVQLTQSILWHNKLTVPDSLPLETARLVNMLRDCDKLDVLALVGPYYTGERDAEKEGVQLDLPDNDHISRDVVQAFLNGQMIDKKYLKTVSDFKILQLGWIYDINYTWCRQQLIENGSLKVIVETLPDEALSRRLWEHILEFLNIS